MTTPMKPSDTGPAFAWHKWIFWPLATIALVLLVLEHRAHALGWSLHAFLLGLCVALLYLVIRVDGGSGDGPK